MNKLQKYLCTIFFMAAANAHGMSSHALLITESYGDSPLIYYSNDNASTWNKAHVSFGKGDPKYGLADLSDITCTTNKTCITAGVLLSHKDQGLILISEDNGENWVYNRFLPPSAYHLFTVHCQDKFCFAGGATENYQGTSLIQSYDRGKNWQAVPQLTNFVGRENYFSTSECSDTLCTLGGVGAYQDGDKTLPIAVYSNDKAKTWLPIKADVPAVPNFWIYKTACGAAGCSHLGYYTVNGIDKHFLLTSNTDGSVWKFHDNFDTDTNVKFRLSSLTYIADSILLVGSQNYQTVILQSKDNGESWQAKKIADIPAGKFNELSDISCNGSLCRGIGSYETNNNDDVFFIKSEDGGESWEYNRNIYNLPIRNAFSFDLKCSGDTCLSYDMDALLVSWDGGFSWMNRNLSEFIDPRTTSIRGAAFSK